MIYEYIEHLLFLLCNICFIHSFLFGQFCVYNCSQKRLISSAYKKKKEKKKRKKKSSVIETSKYRKRVEIMSGKKNMSEKNCIH